ncbi:energy transducer TonB [Hymenobacter taeanensis]
MLADYHAVASGGPIVICESVPAYQKRNKKDSLPLFVQEHLHWPVIGGRVDVEGRVFVSFVVGTDGNVYRAKIVKGLHPDFDAEALRAVQLLSGHFSPAICGGIARPYEMVVPVLFLWE